MLCNLDGGLRSLPDQVLQLLLKQSEVPSVAGPPPTDVVRAVFASLQAGRINRHEFGAEFNHYLTDKKVAGAASRLKRLGRPSRAEVVRTYERGGMEVTVTRLTFKKQSVSVLMYRKPNGTIEEFFIDKD